MDTIQNGYLASYLEQNTKLAKTIVVKLDEAVELMNEGIVAKYGSDAVDTFDPTTWKYYKNVSGQYHPTDVMMRVVSIDTLETIDFTLENLAQHTATAAAFSYGTRHYNALVATYPEQELLINGILTPADIDKAIAAESGDIIAYPKDLVESNEASLIAELSDYIKRIIARWLNAQFAMSDNLYIALFFTTLSNYLLPKLLNIRLARCKTEEAHSFHVRMYLASHHALDRYLPYMTLKQSLWLYRNIAYIERYAGRTEQFNTLVQHLLTDRGIPLGEYSIRHQDEFSDNLFPVVKARLKWINTDSNVYATEIQSTDQVFEKERDLVVDNAIILTDKKQSYVEQLQASNSSVIQTKLLNSAMVDYSNAVPEPFEVVALRQWCYLANRGMYPVSISFKDPKTSETRTLFAKDAFLYLYYLELYSSGLTLTVFPDYLNMQQRRHPKPSLEDLLSVTDTVNHNLKSIAQAILDRQPVVATCYSVSAFYAHAKLLTDEAYWHWFLISSMEDYYERAQVENMTRRLYEDERVKLKPTESTVELWLEKNNLPAYDLTYNEAQELISVVFEAATGRKLDEAKALKNIQKAMLDIMAELSSYTIQLTRSINTEDIIAINWPALRLGTPKSSQSDHRNVSIGNAVLDRTMSGATSVEIGILQDQNATMKGSPVSQNTPTEIDASVGIETLAPLTMIVEDTRPIFTIDITYNGQDEALEEDMMLPGYTTFNSLPESSKKLLKFH